MENTATFGRTSQLQRGIAMLSMFALTTVVGGAGAVIIGWAIAVVGDALK